MSKELKDATNEELKAARHNLNVHRSALDERDDGIARMTRRLIDEQLDEINAEIERRKRG